MITSKKLSALVRAGLVLVVAVVAGAPAQAVVKQVITGSVPAAVAQLQPTGSLPGLTNLNLAIGLPLRNQAALTTLLHQLYDPASPKYRHYLTPAQFTAAFGPTAHDYQALINFVKAHGLTVTGLHPNRVLLDVQGTAANIEQAFHLALNVYQHPTEDRMFYAPNVDPSLNLAVPVLTINGLNNYSVQHPMQLIRKPSRPAKNAAPPTGSGADGTYLGYDFRNAYLPSGTNNPTGAGQVVGLVEFDGYFPKDIAMYAQKAGLPNVPLVNVLLNGATGIPVNPNWEIEVALDIEMAISMAPGLAKVIVYEAPNGSSPNDILSRIVSDNQAKQISYSWSWGSSGSFPDLTADNLFLEMAAQGQSFFVASGDSDAISAADVAEVFPADDPYVTSVGATTLTTAGPGGFWKSETVWNWGLENGSFVGSSGGISTNYPIPYWQQGVITPASHGSTTMRNFPDVAMVGDNIEVFHGNGQQTTVGGTSCAAPLWAAFVALANQQAVASGHSTVGFLNPAIYGLGNSPDFHDITTGNNTNAASSNQFFAVAGYDLCTGWGTPAGSNMINDLTGTLPQQFDITRNALYWFTHGYTNDPTCATLEQAIVANGGVLNLGFMALPVRNENSDTALDAIDTFMEALGFYYKGSGTAGDGSPASALCQARKKLAPELIAAIANNVLIGTDPVNASYNTGSGTTNFPSDLIAQATQVAAGSDVAGIQLLTALLHKFNASGVTNNFPPGGLVECSPNPITFFRQITRDTTTYLNCPGLNDSCATAEAVVFPTASNPFTPARFVRTGIDTRKYTVNTGYWKIDPLTGTAGRQFTVKTTGSNFSPILTVLAGQCTVVVTNGIATIGANNLTVIANGFATNSLARPQVSFTTDGVSTNFIEVGGVAGKLNLTITSP